MIMIIEEMDPTICAWESRQTYRLMQIRAYVEKSNKDFPLTWVIKY